MRARKRGGVAGDAGPSHGEREQLGVDNSGLVAEIEDDARVAAGEVVAPEVDLAEVGAVVHARLEPRDPPTDLLCGQGGDAITGQVPLGP
jgi:hypothetical protein